MIHSLLILIQYLNQWQFFEQNFLSKYNLNFKLIYFSDCHQESCSNIVVDTSGINVKITSHKECQNVK